MKIGDMVRIKGDPPRLSYGIGIILRVKKEPTPGYNARIMEVLFTSGRTYTITEPLLEVINEGG